jgi:outer membrane lipoprotein-sorting protein
MNPLRLAIAPLLALLLAVPAGAEPLSLADLSAYLNGLRTAEADFTQLNADGSRSTGKLYIVRPGRARFEYAPPENTLVLASGGQVAVIDGKSNQAPEQYPLKRTPLNLVLAPNIDLARASMVVGHGGDDTATWVEAQDPEHPEYGSIMLVFTAQPIELRQWVIRDEGGNETTVLLDKLTTGGTYSQFLFEIPSRTSGNDN